MSTPRSVAARRVSRPNIQVRDTAAAFHVRQVWTVAVRSALLAADPLWQQMGQPDLRTRAGRDLLGGHVDLAFVGELGSHLASCGLCYRRHADGGVPADILRTMVKHRPMWAVYRPVELEMTARLTQQRRGKGWTYIPPPSKDSPATIALKRAAGRPLRERRPSVPDVPEDESLSMKALRSAGARPL